MRRFRFDLEHANSHAADLEFTENRFASFGLSVEVEAVLTCFGLSLVHKVNMIIFETFYDQPSVVNLLREILDLVNTIRSWLQSLPQLPKFMNIRIIRLRCKDHVSKHWNIEIKEVDRALNSCLDEDRSPFGRILSTVGVGFASESGGYRSSSCYKEARREVLLLSYTIVVSVELEHEVLSVLSFTHIMYC